MRIGKAGTYGAAAGALSVPVYCGLVLAFELSVLLLVIPPALAVGWLALDGAYEAWQRRRKRRRAG